MQVYTRAMYHIPNETISITLMYVYVSDQQPAHTG